jgi:hypothetical protein
MAPNPEGEVLPARQTLVPAAMAPLVQLRVPWGLVVVGLFK